MEKAKEYLKVSDEDSEIVSRVTVPTHRPGIERSFFQDFILNGIKIDRIDPGFVVCSFKVPPRLTDELEITSRVLGQRGGCSGTIILIRNKATGKVVAEGRHSLFSKHTSKL
ncbi:hypothetical protein ACSBR2_032675 [Camellia fascicularis]